MTVNNSNLNIGSLMGSLNRSSSAMSGIYENLGQAKMIAGGSYHKLLSNYYKQYSKDGESKTSNATGADDAKTIEKVKTSADELSKATDALRGEKQYSKDNMDDLYKKVSAYVDAYNDTVDVADDSNTKGVLSAGSKMVKNTAANESMLSKVGISVDSKNKLSIDKEKFMAADVNTVKTLFAGAGSYGYQTKLQASMMKSAEESEAKKTATYNANGSYGNNYATSYNDYI